MAFSAATSQVTVEAARQAIKAADLALELYIQVNNPGRLAATDAALTAAKNAITAVQT